MLSSVLLLLTMCVSGYAVVPETLFQSDIDNFLSGHNRFREIYNCPHLVWNSTLASVAGNFGSQCSFLPSNKGYGENLYRSNPKVTNNVELASSAMWSWIGESSNLHDSAWKCILDGTNSCAHWSQMVWKKSTSLGCAIVHCEPQMANFVVCEYYPQGNIRGETPF